MKIFTSIFIISCSLFNISICFSQAPEIAWQNTIGGSGNDYFMDMKPTFDGGFILGGYSQSGMSGDKSENVIGAGSSDYWIVKINSAGNVEWENTIGGNWDDNFESMTQTTDGGYLLGGWSNSGLSGDKSENAIVYAAYDYWVVKLSETGDVIWENTIGGNVYDYLFSVEQTADGGYILGGSSGSGIFADKTEEVIGGGTTDYWIVKLDATGIIQWQKTIGGNGYDYLESFHQTADGGFILGGRSDSDISGYKTEGNLGGYDYWVVKLSSTGNIQWQNTIGGSGEDHLYTIQQTEDNGFILGGFSTSGTSLEKSEGNIGDDDYWIIKLNEDGNIEWENTIGGAGSDRLNSVIQTSDGGYFLGGWSGSLISGDKTENSHGDYDFWCLKLNAGGEIIWQKTVGGTAEDVLKTVNQNSDNSYLLGGYSGSGISGDKTEINLGVSGSYDYWVVKLFPDICTTPSGLFANNITYDHAKLNWNNVYGAEKYQVFYRVEGMLEWTKTTTESNFKNLSGLIPNTSYEYKIRTKCSGENTEFSTTANFTTLPYRQENYNNLTTNKQITIYPNPASNQITVLSPQSSVDNSSIIISDISGKIIFQNELTSPETVIGVSNYAAGIYFIQLTIDGEMKNLKFIKQ